MLQILYYISLLWFSYLLINKIELNHKKKKFTKNFRNINNQGITIYKTNLIKKIKQLKYIQKIDTKLKLCGNPLKLTGFSYCLIKLIFIILATYSFLSGNINNAIRNIAIIIALELYITTHNKIENSKIYNDLLYIVQSLYLQTNAGVTLKDALKNINILCTSKRLKKAVITLATRYELTGYDIKKATSEFEKQFNIQEIKLFTNALNQQLSSEVSTDMLENLYSILKNKYISRLNTNTKLKVIYITLGVLIILINISLLVMVPIFTDVFENMQNIFT